MVASVCTLSDVHRGFYKGYPYSMNRIEFILLVRKISVPDPVICGVFVLATGILVNHMTQDVNHMTQDVVPPIIITTDERHDICFETITSGDSIILSPRRTESWQLYQNYTDSSYRLVINKARLGLAE